MGRLEYFLNLHRESRPDRRIFRRMRPFWVRCDLGFVLDISSDGLRILAKKPRKGITEVRLWDERQGLIHEAEVKWCRRLRFRQYEIGLQFIDFGPEMKNMLAEIAARLKED